MGPQEKIFDIVVLGGGPGGYPAAIRAAQLGLSVGLIEAKEMGGTCLNRGCIPSKTLIANAEVLQKIRDAKEFGVMTGEVSFDFAKMVEKKDQTVTTIRKNLERLIASNKITLIRGFGKFKTANTIEVTGQDGCIVKTKKVIIATGSEPRNIPAFPFDHERILDSTSLLERKQLPSKLLIVGGGVIGCEFASLFSILGTEVTVVEMMPRLVPMECNSVSNALQKSFQKRKIALLLNTLVQKIEKTDTGISALIAGGTTLTADIALIAVGRKLNTDNIGLKEVGVVIEESGQVKVNDRMETTVPGIYAVGDIASKWWLAHVASHQGLVAASNAAGQEAHIDYRAVPSVIFTDPEIGTVGLSLDEAIKEGYAATIASFPFQALGRSQATQETEGFAQIVTDKNTGQILGAQVVGHQASSLIAEMAVAIASELTIESISETIHAHPTIPEAWLEAALIAGDAPLHFPPKPKRT